MATQELDKVQERQTRSLGPLAQIPSVGFVTRRKRPANAAWRETVTQHTPESWNAARLALQARIAALDVN
jgi:hypothetical protein